MTHLAVYVPLLAAACFGWLGPAAARRLAPRHAVWLLSAGGAVAAAGTLAALGLLAWTLVGQQPEIAAEGRWSAHALQANAPADRLVTGAALCALAILAVSLAATAARRLLALRAAYRTARTLRGGSVGLVVIDEPGLAAYAVPGRPGQVVVARGLLAALSPVERRALLAHERAHLEHGHHWHVLVVDLATAVNPLLRTLRAEIAIAVERWADEDAAHAAGCRRATARALARAALASLAAPAGATLAAGSSGVPLRVAALLAGPPRARPALARVLIGVLVVSTVAALIAARETEHLFELAMRAYAGGAAD